MFVSQLFEALMHTRLKTEMGHPKTILSELHGNRNVKIVCSIN